MKKKILPLLVLTIALSGGANVFANELHDELKDKNIEQINKELGIVTTSLKPELISFKLSDREEFLKDKNEYLKAKKNYSKSKTKNNKAKYDKLNKQISVTKKDGLYYNSNKELANEWMLYKDKEMYFFNGKPYTGMIEDENKGTLLVDKGKLANGYVKYNDTMFYYKDGVKNEKNRAIVSNPKVTVKNNKYYQGNDLYTGFINDNGKELLIDNGELANGYVMYNGSLNCYVDGQKDERLRNSSINVETIYTQNDAPYTGEIRENGQTILIYNGKKANGYVKYNDTMFYYKDGVVDKRLR